MKQNLGNGIMARIMKNKKYKLTSNYKKILADTITPVSIYLKLRDKFPNSILLESSDYHGNQDIYSYICCLPIAGFKAEGGDLTISYPDGFAQKKKIDNTLSMTDELSIFSSSFETNKLNLPFITSGLFGYCSYDAVRYFEDIEINTFPSDYRKIPDIQYHVYRYIIVFNHFNNEVFIIDNTFEGNGESQIEKIESFIGKRDFASYKFNLIEREESNFTDAEFLNVLQQGVNHFMRGDVFQIVLSRRFSRQYNGDDFNVYRSLRSINPSPYLFYFDYGSFRIFGSSPEAQMVIRH